MARFQKKSISVILAAISFAPLLMLVMTLKHSMIEDSIARSHEIELEFSKMAALIDDFYAKNSRLPNQEEFRISASLSEHSPLFFSPPPFDLDVVSEAGNPPPAGYVLEYWRGERMERYVSWTRRSTMQFEPSAYFLFHSQLAQAALMFGLASLCIVMSAWAWPKKKASSVRAEFHFD